MIPLPKPRGFWDYGLFALGMTGLLLFLFWLEAGDSLGWTDAALAFGTSVLCALAIVLARRGEKASWLARPTVIVYLLSALGTAAWMFGAIYVDEHIVHRMSSTSSQLARDVVPAAISTAAILWYFRRPRTRHFR